MFANIIKYYLMPLSTDVRFCSILPTIQAKAALILKNERFPITYITDYHPMLFSISVS
jgi:hypothetical protein